MAALDYAEFWTTLKKGTPAPYYYFYGTEEVLKDEALAALLDLVLEPALRDFNIDQRSAQQLQPDEVITLCTTLPMMADRRVVVIRDVESWVKRSRAKGAVLSYLDQPVPETVLVLIQGGGDPEPDPALASKGTAVAFAPLRRDRALRWLARRAEGLGLALVPEAAAHLLDATEGRLDAVAMELAKLSGLAGTEPVTVAQVEELVGVRHGETPADWRDAVLADQPDRALRMLPHVLAQPGVSGVRLVSLLGQGLVGLALTRGLFDEGRRGGGLIKATIDGLKRGRVWGLDYGESARNWAGWVRAWPADRLRQALRAALEADQALKSTTISTEEGILTDLVLSVATAERSPA